MSKNDFRKFISRHEALLASIALCLGFALRLYALGAAPYELNQDEASAGYDAWALLNYGVDRCGKSWPVLLTAWGSGQNALMSYLAMPFIALFGLTPAAVRLPNAISACLTLVVFWRIARRARGRAFGLCALFVLCLCPWHIMLGRWALESNQLPFWLISGAYAVQRSRERPWLLVPGAVCLALCLYAYGTAFFFLPFFIPGALVWLRRGLRPGPTLCAAAVFALLALPIALCQLINALGLDELRILGMTLPRLTEARQARTSVFGGGSVFRNLAALAKILLTQSDGMSFNSMPLRWGGMFYFFGLPAAAAGLIAAVSRSGRRTEETPMLIGLSAGILSAALIDGNINRLNMLWLFIVYFEALGIYICLRRFRAAALAAGPALLALAAVFAAQYRDAFAVRCNPSFYPGLCEAISCASELTDGEIYVTDFASAAYIFVLFAQEYDPEAFAAEVVYEDPDAAFRTVTEFGRYKFGALAQADADIYVLQCSEIGEREVIAEFGHYRVCR